MEYKDINDYKINIDTYSKLIEEIKNLPESKIDFSNIFINTVTSTSTNAANQISQVFNSTESTVSPNLDDEQEKEDLLEEPVSKEEPLPKEQLVSKEEPVSKEETVPNK